MLAIEHGGKSYELKPRTITPALLDEVAPIRERMKNLALEPELIAAALDEDKIFNLIDPLTKGMREGVSPEDLLEFARSSRRLMKALTAPTEKLNTSPAGIALMAEIIKATVDRSRMSDQLKADIDSNHVATKTTEKADELTDEATEVVVPRSAFWGEFPLDVMIEYVETFCKRARI